MTLPRRWRGSADLQPRRTAAGLPRGGVEDCRPPAQAQACEADAAGPSAWRVPSLCGSRRHRSPELRPDPAPRPQRVPLDQGHQLGTASLAQPLVVGQSSLEQLLGWLDVQHTAAAKTGPNRQLGQLHPRLQRRDDRATIRSGRDGSRGATATAARFFGLLLLRSRRFRLLNLRDRRAGFGCTASRGVISTMRGWISVNGWTLLVASTAAGAELVSLEAAPPAGASPAATTPATAARPRRPPTADVPPPAPRQHLLQAARPHQNVIGGGGLISNSTGFKPKRSKDLLLLRRHWNGNELRIVAS